jgi:hypothetical protein
LRPESVAHAIIGWRWSLDVASPSRGRRPSVLYVPRSRSGPADVDTGACRTPLILYAIGAAAFGYGWYTYWRTGHVGPDPFVVASICVVSAAGIQVARDLWRWFLHRLVGRR